MHSKSKSILKVKDKMLKYLATFSFPSFFFKKRKKKFFSKKIFFKRKKRLFALFRRRYTSRAFVLPVTIFTILYNVPKFFELYVREDPITEEVECQDVMDDPDTYSKYLKNCTDDVNQNITIPVLG